MLLIVMCLSMVANAETKKIIISPNHSDIIVHKTVIKPRPVMVVDRKQLSCIAETIYSESRGESLAGQYAVGHTIMNRSRNILHEAPCAIVKQQYTQKHIPKEDTDEFYSIAKDVMIGNYRNVAGNVDSFDSFKNVKHPKGSILIGNHWFYKALKKVA